MDFKLVAHACISLLLISFAAAFKTEGLNLYEGDIKLSPIQRLSLEVFGDPTAQLPLARGLTRDPQKLWSTHVIPYTITSELKAIPDAMTAIQGAIEEWQQNSCLKFVPRKNQVDYLEFYKSYGCWSSVGRQGGKQQISINEGCFTAGAVAHEMGHAVGFWHEQNRPDRDNFVDILWDNIPEGLWINFKKQTHKKIDSLGFPYDYISLMHYEATAFGGGNITIRAKDPSVVQLGQRIALSPLDIKQADALYKCNGVTTMPRPTLPRPHKGPDDCTFDSDTCGWTVVSGTGHYTWSRRMGDTTSFFTGPQADHTTGRLGYYMFTDATPGKGGDKAILESTSFRPGGQKCFHFYYHMYGRDIATLSVIRNRLLSSKKALWSKSGNQGNKWRLASVQLPASRTSYKLSFQAIRGPFFEGDLAIDDIYFTDGRC